MKHTVRTVLETCRGINEFKYDYQPTTNLLKDDLHADSHSILNRWKNHFCQLLNIQYMELMVLGRVKYIELSC